SLTSTGAGIQAISIVAGVNNDVTLDAQGGAITDDGLAAVDVTADVLTADAVTGIDLDTQAVSISGTNTTSGDIQIDNTDAGGGTTTINNLLNQDTGGADAGGSITFTNTGGNLTIAGAVTNNDAGPINIDNTGGAITINAPVSVTTGAGLTGNETITITAHSPITVNANITAPGDITLDAQEAVPAAAGDDLTLNANVTSTGGNIILYAGDDIIQNTGTVSTNGGTITAEAAHNDNDSAGSFTQAAGTSFVSGSGAVATGGAISVTARDNVNLALLDARGTTTNGNVTVTSTNADITDSDLGTVPTDIDIYANDLTLSAANNIGGPSPAEIDISMTGNLTMNAGGSIYVGFLGDVSLGAITAGNLWLSATDNIYDDERNAANTAAEAGYDWTLVNITGNLTLIADSDTDGTGQIGIDHNTLDNDMDAGYLDLRVGGTGTFSSSGDVYLNFDQAAALNTSNLTVNSPNNGNTVAIVNSSGNINYNGGTFQTEDNLIFAAVGDFNLNSGLTHALTTNSTLVLNATNDVNLGANLSTIWGDINIAGDFSSNYLGIARDSVGAITQSAGTVLIGDANRVLTLEAGSGIGAAGVPIFTQVRNLVAYNTDGTTGSASGHIVIDNTGRLNIIAGALGDGVRNEGGVVNITAHSPIYVLAPIWAVNNIMLTANGAVDGDIDVGANITSGSGGVYLTAGSDIMINTGIISSNNLIHMIAGGEIAQTGGTVGSGSEDLVLDAGDDINVSNADVNRLAAKTTSGYLLVTNNGNLTLADILGTWGYAISNSDKDILITVNAAGAEAGDLTISSLVQNTGTGQVILYADNDITQNANITTNGEDVEIDAGNLFTMGNDIQINTTAGTAEIDIEAGGNVTLGQLITGNAIVESTGGSITAATNTLPEIQANSADLKAATGIGGANFNTQIGTLKAEVTGTGNMEIYNNGGLTITSAITNNGSIKIDTQNDMTVNFVEAGGTGDVTLIVSTSGNMNIDTIKALGDDIYLSVNTGGILDNNGALTNITANGLSGDSDNGISLDTVVSQMALNNDEGQIDIFNQGDLDITTVGTINGITNDGSTGPADINLVNVGSLTISQPVSITTDGAIDIQTHSPVNVNANVSAPGNVSITAGDNDGATTDDIAIAANINIQSTGGDVYLTAGDDITQAAGTGVISAGG
ncbi:hypothetical protein DRN74_06330, partial [Candidatus Micrarchaeota archaeon]